MNSMHFKFPTDTSSSTPVENNKKRMKSEIARDILKRCNEFPSNVDAAHEYYANAYESYDADGRPMVIISIEKDKIVVTDYGCGMDAETFERYWCMHAETKRRPNGLNRRGYNGTGKIAGLRFAERIHVSTVRDGLRQTAYLDLAEVRLAASERRDPELVTLEHDMPTAARNGTVITISKPLKEQFPNGFDAEFIRGNNAKLSKERMMWMFMGHISLNQVPVEAMEIPRDETHMVHSPCGNFKAEIFYLEKGYEHELQDVHVFINGVIVAAEKWGKDGHRLANRVYVKCETTAEWAQANFEHQRERFTSESRNLRMKTIVPAAQDYKNFVTAAVSDYMKILDQKDAERRKEYMDKQLREMEDRMAKLLSNMFSTARRLRRQGTGTPRGSYLKHEMVERSQRKPSLSTFSCRLEEFSNDQERYRYNTESLEISVNTKFAHLKAISATGVRTYATEQAILETVIAAFVEMETGIRLNEKFNELGPRSVSEYNDEARIIRQEIERTAYGLVKSQFEAFRKLSNVVSTSAEEAAIELSAGE
jgi:peroxiredoxin